MQAFLRAGGIGTHGRPPHPTNFLQPALQYPIGATIASTCIPEFC
jgi:hypothetical protein